MGSNASTAAVPATAVLQAAATAVHPVAAAPEVILVTEHDLRLFGGAEGLWKAYPTLRQTPAGQANRVWVMPDVQLKYTSVGSGVGALALAKALAALPKA